VTSVLRRSSAVFFFAALAIVGVCVAIARSRAFAAHPDVAAWGITFDLTISIPLVYWFLVVRTGKAQPLTIAPVFLIGMALAAVLLPRTQQQFLSQLRTFVLPAVELVLVAAMVQRIRLMRRQSSASPDPYVRIATAARALAGEGRVAEVIASETAMVYYAIFGWRQQPAATRGHTFTLHERNGWSTIVVCLIVMIVAESIGMHLLLGLWSPVAAWVWTGLDLWGIVWLLGDAQALRLRLSSIDDEMLHVRYGLRWSVSVPLANIAAVDNVRSESEWKRRDVLKVAILDEPRWLITLREPVMAIGLAGIRKEIRGLALLPDDDETISVLRRACVPSPAAADAPAAHR
jgi:hypothetical protein